MKAHAFWKKAWRCARATSTWSIRPATDFPRCRGGPMFYADTVGLKTIYDRILEFQRTLDRRYWQPAPLLERLANANSSFAQWQADRLAVREVVS